MVDSAAVTPGPLIPDYVGPCVRGIVPALLGPSAWSNGLPAWMPQPVADAEQAVLLILDGLGWEQLDERRHLMPTLSSMVGGPICTVAPTTTATALCSIATGLTPAEHGLLGYRVLLGGEVLNVLRWNSLAGDRRRTHPPRDVQPFAAFMGHGVPVISPADLQHTAFTEAHLRGSRPVGWRAPSAIAVEVAKQLAAGERFVYAYYGGIDKTAHERGFGEYYDAELRFADRLVADALEALGRAPCSWSPPTTARSMWVTVSSTRVPTCWRWLPSSLARAASAGGTPSTTPAPTWPRPPTSSTPTWRGS